MKKINSKKDLQTILKYFSLKSRRIKRIPEICKPKHIAKNGFNKKQ